MTRLRSRPGCEAAAKRDAPVPMSGPTTSWLLKAEGVGEANDEFAHGPGESSALLALGVSEPRKVNRHQVRVVLPVAVQVGSKANRLSGHGAAARERRASRPSLSAKRIESPSTVRNCGSMDPFSRYAHRSPPKVGQSGPAPGIDPFDCGSSASKRPSRLSFPCSPRLVLPSPSCRRSVAPGLTQRTAPRTRRGAVLHRSVPADRLLTPCWLAPASLDAPPRP